MTNAKNFFIADSPFHFVIIATFFNGMNQTVAPHERCPRSDRKILPPFWQKLGSVHGLQPACHNP